MIEALKGEDIVDRVGGRFRLCALIQRRLVELMDGARPLIDRDGRSDLELVIEEILQKKIKPLDPGEEPTLKRSAPEQAASLPAADALL